MTGTLRPCRAAIALALALAARASLALAGAPGSITTVAGTGNFLFAGDGGPATLAHIHGPTGVAVDAAGNLYIADQGNEVVRVVSATTGVITTFAGNNALGLGYSGDGGPATNAQLVEPSDVAFSPSGDLYIADTGNNCIRMVSMTTGTISTVAGDGNGGFSGDGGLATQAEFNTPVALAFDAAGDLFIVDRNNNRIRRVDHNTSIITTVAGSSSIGFSGDGAAATLAELLGPSSVAVDAAGNVFFADQSNRRVREVFAASGNITTVAGTGTSGSGGDGGQASLAELNDPTAVFIDGAGNLYIGDEGSQLVREVAAGTNIITTIAGDGSGADSGDGGPATLAGLDQPFGMAMDAAGDLYFAEQGGNRVRVVDAAAPAPTATPSATATPSDSPTPASACPIQLIASQSFTVPAGTSAINVTFTVAAGLENSMLIIAFSNFGGGGLFTASYAGLTTTSLWDSSEGSGYDKVINYLDNPPAGAGTLSISNLFDTQAAQFVVILYSGVAPLPQAQLVAGGTTTNASSTTTTADVTVAGSLALVCVDAAAGTAFSYGPGMSPVGSISGSAAIGAGQMPATALGDNLLATYLNPPSAWAFPEAVVLSPSGCGATPTASPTPSASPTSVAVAPPGACMDAYAGTGSGGSIDSGDGSAATQATLNSPHGLGIDPAGNVLVGDSTGAILRRIGATSGLLSTVLGGPNSGGSFTPPAEGTAAVGPGVGEPQWALAFDGGGNTYFSDNINNCVRRIDASSGIVTTVAGPIPPAGSTGGYSGDNGQATLATLNNPTGLAFDSAGDLFIADSFNYRVRMVAAGTGIITTVAGNGVPATGGAGDGGFATAAGFSYPMGLAFDPSGNLYVSDNNDARVRKIAAGSHTITTFAGGGPCCAGGDGAPASLGTLASPSYVACDAAGDLFIMDPGAFSIREVLASDGFFAAVAGDGVFGDPGVLGSAPAATAMDAIGLAVRPGGTVYFSIDNQVAVLGACPLGTPTWTVSPTQTPSLSCTPTLTASPSPSASVTPTLSFSPSPTATRSATPTDTMSATPSAMPTASPSTTATPSASPSMSPTPTATPCRAASASLQVIPFNPAVTQSFQVFLTLSNTGSAAWTGVQPSQPVISPPGLLSFVGPSSQAPVNLAPGQSASYGWTYIRVSDGPVQVQAGACGLEACDGAAYCLSSASVSIGGPASPTPLGNVVSAAAGQAFVYPAPVTGASFSFAYYLRKAGQVRIRVYNERADLASVLTASNAEGAQTTVMNAGGLAPGVYFYLVDMQYLDGSTETLSVHKFIRIR